MPMASSPFRERTAMLLALLLLLPCISTAATTPPLASSEAKALYRVTRLLGSPPALAALATSSNPCAIKPTPSLSIACAGGHVTSLAVLGDRRPDAAWHGALPSTFSADALFTTLTRLPALARLSLVALGVWGALPGAKLRRLDNLQALNLTANYLYGALPSQLARMHSLRTLALANNWLNGTVPSLADLAFLEELDLGQNKLGGAFPEVGKAVARLVLAGNNFTGRIPAAVSSLGNLRFLDASRNRLQGWIPSAIFSLPALRRVDLSRNRLSGQLPAGTACSAKLEFVDLSDNLLVGARPACMRSSTSPARTVLVAGNCFADAKLQRPSAYCSPAAIAALLPPAQGNGGAQGGRKGRGVGMVLGIVAAVVAGALLVALVMVVVLRRVRRQHPEVMYLPKSPLVTPGKKAERGKAPAMVIQKIATNAEKRHASQAARVNTLEVPGYRAYTIEELQEVTDNFASSNLIKSNPLTQHYNGQLQDGSRVLVRCLRLKPKYSTQSLSHYMEIISKFRHRHLVSSIGHCIVSDQENNIASSVYLISECVSNGSLRSHLNEWRKREMLKWPQRVSAAIGIARGIQFLHNLTAPDIVQNDLNIENILLDKTLTSKISGFNLPMISTSKNGKISSENPFVVHEENDHGSAQPAEQGDKDDIYQFGLILLEVITGKSTESQRDLESLKSQLSEALAEDPDMLKDMADPTIRGTFAVDSLSKVTEIALNCTANDPNDRPSVDDLLWNLQYSMQVQDGWASSESLSLSVKSQS